MHFMKSSATSTAMDRFFWNAHRKSLVAVSETTVSLLQLSVFLCQSQFSDTSDASNVIVKESVELQHSDDELLK